uniref:Uncharacterized protein n=1 Tax=Nelumbo nucifera TaxID=4432 RepID=A0A822YUJ4_NELNU|nr:TPA_asm: hypothetical protein HUJ06_005871 [Nelumbo nucifera]
MPYAHRQTVINVFENYFFFPTWLVRTCGSENQQFFPSEDSVPWKMVSCLPASMVSVQR